PSGLPARPGERPGGASRMRARRSRGRGRTAREAGAAVPRRAARGARALRAAGRCLQRLRRVRDAEGGRARRLAGRATGGAGGADCDQARRRRLHRQLLDERARRMAVTAGLGNRAREVIPGGVNSPVRAMRAVGLEEPLFVRRGEGAWIEDEVGRRYIDWVMSWGPLICGHADPETVEAVIQVVSRGTTFGAATEREVELAEELVDAVPSLEMVRLVSSGTEAAMSAVRLARAATRRDRILKFAGGYHGHAD